MYDVIYDIESCGLYNEYSRMDTLLMQKMHKQEKKAPHQIEDELILKAVRWASRTSAEIYKAGGSSDALMKRIPDDLITTFVRNGLELKHVGNA